MTRLHKTLILFVGTICLALFISILIKHPKDWSSEALAGYLLENISPIGTVFVALLSVSVNIPLIKDWLNAPVITLKLLGPEPDNEGHYWHIEIENNGGILNKGALFLVAQQKAEQKEQPIQFVRFRWPYEDFDIGRSVERSIIKRQQVDLFSADTQNGTGQLSFITVQPRPLPATLKLTKTKHPSGSVNAGEQGRLITLQPVSQPATLILTKVKLPQEAEEFLDIALQVIGENHQTDPEWFHIKKTGNSWYIAKRTCLKSC